MSVAEFDVLDLWRSAVTGIESEAEVGEPTLHLYAPDDGADLTRAMAVEVANGLLAWANRTAVAP